ncbi:mitochondrial genome maintenance protein [Filobasidium floriforme]|uniref:mitochondrial genome maintenance protein n=1 Tax=Filobasidium floriforme TaxID=5210 RepID=UPI001E8E73A5|nr:mitochondrial genome maintenance protein [Filobasidium floriforme]KAH8084050.1 mitochondrial genome maintenance protein [Filobasidium floriforme]
MSKHFATATRFARTFSTSPASRLSQNLPRAAAATSTSTVPSRPASDVAKTPQRRTVYARVAKPAGTTSTYRRTPVKPAAAAAPTPRNAVESSEPSMPDLDALDAEEASFPDPQPVAELPDYVRLAPPIDHSGAPARRTEPALPSPALSEHPVHAGRNIEVGEDWTTSFYGLSAKPFPKDVANVLLRPLAPTDIEIKPDGLIYLPEIKYRRTLNEAFGPGGWGMAPRGETTVGPRIVSREWGLVCLGRLVAIARGEQEYFDPSGVPTATEACKSNALMRCCKDLGIASELWDPSFIKQFKNKHCTEAFVEHVVQKKKRKLWRKNDTKFDYPYKEC